MNTVVVKEAVTCAEMARMCGLSRSRFYSLVKEGIMPEPSRNPETQRPFYSREQQEQCLLVRRTNCGINGRPILFYAQRLPTADHIATPRRAAVVNRRQRVVAARDPIVTELQHGLAQLGMSEVPEPRVKAALAAAHPDGHANVPTPQLLMSVFRRLREEGSANG